MASATTGATRDAFGEKLAELGAAEPRLVVLDADLGGSTRTTAFMKKFPERRFELGIAEQNMIGAAAGLALGGKIPVATSFACFLTGRLETIRVCVAYNRTNVKLVGTHAGIGIGDDGPSQMALEDVAAMRALPGMTVLQPADRAETRQAVEWMVRHDGPVYLRLTRQNVPEIHEPGYRFEFGKLDPLWPKDPEAEPDLPSLAFAPPNGKPRRQAAILATGGVVSNALEAAKDLQSRGFLARVFNVHTLHPIDAEGVVRAARASQRLVTVEDHNLAGGLGSAVAEALAAAGQATPLVRLGLSDFAESGTTEELYAKYGLSASHIVEAALRNLA
ncbi:MAG: transketolase family protein [Elusimicrobia bacterium]|nr:transketolase family protein [Elusimicrobiota bacterium]